MNYFELICKTYIKKDIAFEQSFEVISKYISYCMTKAGFEEFHKSKGYKYYTFGGFVPVEKEKVYKQGQTYSFTFRCLDEKLADALAKALRENVNNAEMLVIETRKKTLSLFFITELYSATPVIVTLENGRYWSLQESGDIMQLKKQLHDNLEKKYKSFYGESLHVKDNFIQLIEVKNTVPQSIITHKGTQAIRFFGNKFRIVPNEDEVSQKLAFVALACGLGEKNSYGAGFMLGKGMR
ncbi:MAG TPA: CRISPR-associated endoribonuclease Cas6 [Sulfurospirillum sp. UBA11407]|nr:MAG TPA: CRISPR-associated endoribonuclease Cas6 [Sulfurospirillum sp. UBA11407]